jgi:hypothetical protein
LLPGCHLRATEALDEARDEIREHLVELVSIRDVLKELTVHLAQGHADERPIMRRKQRRASIGEFDR